MNVLMIGKDRMLLEAWAETVRCVLPDAAAAFCGTEDVAVLPLSALPDIAIVDADPPDGSGIEAAAQLQERFPQVNLIFCAGTQAQLPQAMALYCSDYLLNPLTAEKLIRAAAHLRTPVQRGTKKIRFQCFGAFEAYYEEKPIRFRYTRTKEMLAFLVHRNGADCTTGEMLTELFELDEHRSYFNKLRSDLLDTFAALGESHVIRCARGTLGINRESVSCDYFDYRDGKTVLPAFAAYMQQYDFGVGDL